MVPLHIKLNHLILTKYALKLQRLKQCEHVLIKTQKMVYLSRATSRIRRFRTADLHVVALQKICQDAVCVARLYPQHVCQLCNCDVCRSPGVDNGL